MAKNGLATVKLFRFDPEIDAKPRYSEFRAPYKGRTVLDVLLYIYQNLDSAITFRWACGKGFCRSCVVLVNGKPVLACREPAGKHMEIEPHPKFKIIKDLLIDLSKLK